jgi:carbonic anhydrase
MACCLTAAQLLLLVGVDQSPIALSFKMPSLLRSEPIRVHFADEQHPFVFDGSGDPLFAYTTDPPKTENAGTHYNGRQFHFHEPGEHPINGHTYPLEAHIVLDGDDLPQSVLALAWVLRRTKHRSSAIVRDALKGKPMRVPPFSALFVYTGSLTTGDTNSQNVNWLVNIKPLKVTDEDLAELKARGLVQTARPVQDRAGRAVSKTKTSCCRRRGDK